MVTTPSTAGDAGPGSATASPQAQPSGQAAEAFVSLVRRIEAEPAVDLGATVVAALAGAVVRTDRVGRVLRGAPIGHALHPLLTDFPLGAWMSASFLDLFGGRGARGPAQRLVGFGLLASIPTVAAGLAEWQSTSGRKARRVGVVHAAVSSTATALYGSSWLARRRGSHASAVLLGVTGGLVATTGGYFGGHLSLVRKVGTADAAFGHDDEAAAPG